MTDDETSQHKPNDEKIKNGSDVQKDEPWQPLDGGWGYIIVVASFAINFISDGTMNSFGLLYIQLLEEFNEGKSYTSWILSLMSGMSLCAGPISSMFVNKYGFRAVTIAGSILAALSLLASSYAQNILTLILTIGFGLGSAMGLLYLPAIVSVTVYFEKYRSVATGIAVSGSGLGTFILAPLVEILIQEYSWRKTLMALSGVVLACAFFGTLLRPLKSPSQNMNNPQWEKYTPKMDQNPELEYRQNICYDQKDVKLDEVFRTNIFVKIFESLTKILNLELLKDPIFILFTVSDFANALGYYIPFFCIVDHAIELDISKDRASYLLSIIGISNTLSRVIFGYISDKLKVNRLWIYSTSLCICGLSTVVSVFCTNFYELSIYAAVFGFSIGAYVALRSCILVDLIGLDKLNNAFGLLMWFEGIATFIGPPLVGLFYDLLHTYMPGFVLAGLMIALSGFILFFMPSLQRKQETLEKNTSQKNQHDMEMN